MNTILIFDVETSGIPIWHLPSEDPSQPRVTQIAAELCDIETQKTLAYLDCLIKPNGWTIPDEVAALTGITTEKAMQYGIDIEIVLPAFIEMWKKASLHRVAHNESFDMRMIRIELMRNSFFIQETVGAGDGPEIPFADYWKSAPAFCTQSKSLKLCNLPPTAKMVAANRNGPKPPNLTEAYKHFTGLELVDAHNAATDIMACKAVYFGIQKATAAAAA